VPEQVEDDPTEHRHVLGTVSRADAVVNLPNGDIRDPVLTMLDAPVAAPVRAKVATSPARPVRS
jgi:hypothetical protein